MLGFGVLSHRTKIVVIGLTLHMFFDVNTVFSLLLSVIKSTARYVCGQSAGRLCCD